MTIPVRSIKMKLRFRKNFLMKRNRNGKYEDAPIRLICFTLVMKKAEKEKTTDAYRDSVLEKFRLRQ